MEASKKNTSDNAMSGFFVARGQGRYGQGDRIRSVSAPGPEMTCVVEDGQVTVLNQKGEFYHTAQLYATVEELNAAEKRELMLEGPFTYYWRDGKRDVFYGVSVSDAFGRAGYGGGAIRALDFHAQGDDHSWVWSNSGSGKSDWKKAPAAEAVAS